MFLRRNLANFPSVTPSSTEHRQRQAKIMRKDHNLPKDMCKAKTNQHMDDDGTPVKEGII